MCCIYIYTYNVFIIRLISVLPINYEKSDSTVDPMVSCWSGPLHRLPPAGPCLLACHSVCPARWLVRGCACAGIRVWPCIRQPSNLNPLIFIFPIKCKQSTLDLNCRSRASVPGRAFVSATASGTPTGLILSNRRAEAKPSWLHVSRILRSLVQLLHFVACSVHPHAPRESKRDRIQRGRLA